MMMPMLPLCDSRAMRMPMGQGMPGMAPAMVPMMPMANAPMLCPMNNMNMFSTTSIMSEFDRHMYGRFRHVERDHPRYRHAPFDWYRPPKQRFNIIHEDAAVVTNDGPVPIGDFYRYYIYGDDLSSDDDYSDDDDYYYDDDDGGEYSSSFDSEDYDDTIEPSYEQRATGYRRSPRRGPAMNNEDIGRRRPEMRPNNFATRNPTRRTAATYPTNTNRTTVNRRDDDFDDAASVNSTYGN